MMSRARVFALLAFIALGTAGGSLIVGDATWFAWSAGAGAIALIIWGRTHDRPAAAPRPDPPRYGRGFTAIDVLDLDDLKRNNQVALQAEIAYGWGIADCADLRPTWPVPTNHFGAPE